MAKIGAALSITAGGGNPFFFIDIMTLSGLVSGMIANFNSTLDYAWLIADSGSEIDSFLASKFQLNFSGVFNSYGGTFGTNEEMPSAAAIIRRSMSLTTVRPWPRPRRESCDGWHHGRDAGALCTLTQPGES